MKDKHFSNKDKDKRGNKDWRTPYSEMDKGKRIRDVDWSCRHGGGCMYCELNRRFNNKRQTAQTEDQLDD